MAIYRWPSLLPAPLVSGYGDAGDDGLLWTTVQSGAEKVRPFSSAMPALVSGQLHVTEAGVQVLDDFYGITLKRVGRFWWEDHRRPEAADNAVVYRFKAKPSYSALGGGRFLATLSLQRFGTVQGHFLLSFNDDVNQPTT